MYIHARQIRTYIIYIKQNQTKNTVNYSEKDYEDKSGGEIAWTRLKQKTLHKCFLCPYKRQSSMLCFISFSFSRTPVKSRCRKSMTQGRLHCTNYQYIRSTCTCVESSHYIAFVVSFSNCSKSSNTWLRSLYIAFYLSCKCARYLCAFTHRKAQH